MEPALTLANTPLDLQITICIFLHPSDILALRKTCKALEIATRRRIVWVAVLHQVCLDNTLFLPSFPIHDMSDLELERAAIAPRRWIELQKKHSTDFGKMILHPRTTRIIKHADNPRFFFIVPGGRYLVTAGRGLFVWDLGYVLTADCKLVASVGLEDYFEFYDVQATTDGKGLVILSRYSSDHFSIFEIYPQSEIPLLTQIAQLDWLSDEGEQPVHLLPDILISRAFRDDRVVFKVVDYRTNFSTCFSAGFDFYNSEIYNQPETSATKTAIFMLCEEGIFIWAIPLLSPQPSDLRDHLRDNNPTHIPPLFKIPFPDGHIHDNNLQWRMVSKWYLGSWESVYFDILYWGDLKFQRYKIIIKPDLSDASLHVLELSESISDDLMHSDFFGLRGDYQICEDALVFFWNNGDMRTWRAYAGLTSAPFTSFFTQWDGCVRAFCPTSGRIVYHCTDGPELLVVDLF